MNKNDENIDLENGDERTDQYVSLKAEFEDFAENDVVCECRFRKPGKPKIQRCQKDMNKSPDRAFRTLVLDCVHPEDREKLVQAMDNYPGIPTTFGSEILRRSGFDSLGK